MAKRLRKNTLSPQDICELEEMLGLASPLQIRPNLPESHLSKPLALPECQVSEEGGLPECQEKIGKADTLATKLTPVKVPKQRRRSRGADALMIEGKRAKEVAERDGARAALSPAKSVPIACSPTEELYAHPPHTALTHDTFDDDLDAEDEEHEEEEAASTAKTPFVPWWKKPILREDAKGNFKPSLRRRFPPSWRDLTDEATLDFRQDAMEAIADASNSNLAVFKVDINLDHEIELEARRSPSPLEWVKYRLERYMKRAGSPCSFVMVSEDAFIKPNMADRAVRADKGLPAAQRFHIHALMLLPSSRRKIASFRKAAKAALHPSWETGGMKIAANPGQLHPEHRKRVDYMAKELWKGSRWLEHFGTYKGEHPASSPLRSYQGTSITVTDDVNGLAIGLYETWREAGSSK